MPKYINKCPKHNELDIYESCSFNCIYCISLEKEQRTNFKLDDELMNIAQNQKNSHPYYLSPWTDAYQHQEAQKQYTKQIINTLSLNNHPFFVITKSLLIQRDLDYFRNKIKDSEISAETGFFDAKYRINFPKTGFDFSILALNLLNKTSYDTFNSDLFSVNSKSLVLRPRQFLFKVSFGF